MSGVSGALVAKVVRTYCDAEEFPEEMPMAYFRLWDAFCTTVRDPSSRWILPKASEKAVDKLGAMWGLPMVPGDIVELRGKMGEARYHVTPLFVHTVLPAVAGEVVAMALENV